MGQIGELVPVRLHGALERREAIALPASLRQLGYLAIEGTLASLAASPLLQGLALSSLLPGYDSTEPRSIAAAVSTTLSADLTSTSLSMFRAANALPSSIARMGNMTMSTPMTSPRNFSPGLTSSFSITRAIFAMSSLFNGASLNTSAASSSCAC